MFIEGELQDEYLRIKPYVKIWYDNNDCFRKTFENELDRDQWLKETGLDKVAETLIKV